MSEPLLKVEDLRAGYGESVVLDGISFELGDGASLAVLGRNGVGKSTLLLTLMGFTSVKRGAIVFQGALHALNPVQRVGEQIAEPMLIHHTVPDEKTARARVESLLGRVGLPAGRADSYPHQLSGGQRQRVLIAMALACDPLLLIADEPTTALDLMVQAQVLALLDELKEERDLTLMFITHDLSVLTYACRRLAVMYAGRVVEQGPSREVFENGSHPYTRGLAAAFPTIGDFGSRMKPSGLGGDPPTPGSLPAGCPFHPRCPLARDECKAAEPELRPSGLERSAACILV